MKNAKRIMHLILPAVFFAICVLNVSADESGMYIVKLNESIIQMLEEDTCEHFAVLTQDELDECLSCGIVEWYEEDFEVELFDDTTESETDYSSQKWDLEMINAFRAYDVGCRGQGVRVAVIDSGINSHVDLVNNICDGYCYLTNTQIVTDNIGHGTFVSGLIGAEANGFGINGVAPEVSVVPLKCFDTDVTTRVSTICTALYDAVDEYDCEIINMSLGLTQYSSALEEAVDYALEKGVTVVCAVGNKGTDTLYYPAAFDGVIGVGAVDENGDIASFSQHNESVFVTAPGKGVLSTSNTGGYTTKNGTSFSTPLVSGLVAVMLNVDSELSNDEIMQILSETASDSGDEGYDNYYGYGVVDAEKAFNMLLDGTRCFISPISVIEGKASAVVLNNSDTALEGVCMWGNYTSGIMKGADGTSLLILPGEIATVTCSFNTGQIKCFVWTNIKDIKVITNARTLEVIQ